MSNFKKPLWRSPEYLAYVRTLACCGCGIYGQHHAHHNIAQRFSSAKAGDDWAMALCPLCHSKLHEGWRDWEEQYGTQDRHCLETISQAIRDGVLVIDKKLAKVMANG
jgi:heterodisulfide reductase subunit B